MTRRRRDEELLGNLERALVPRRRAPLPVAAWYWRYELALLAGLVFVVILLLHALGPALTVVAVSVTLGALSPPWSRRLVALAWHMVTPHLLRSGLAQARIHNRNGRLPFITRVSREPFGERIRLWCPAGTSAEDIASARATLRAACWAADIRIWRDELRSQIVTVDVIRRPGCLGPGSAGA